MEELAASGLESAEAMASAHTYKCVKTMLGLK